jgi:hypothetical protein
VEFEANDEFLRAKADRALRLYFGFMEPAFKLAQSGLDVGNDNEKELLKKYDLHGNEYRLEASSLIVEVHNTLELFFKALLAPHGEYMLYNSLEDLLESNKKQKSSYEKYTNDLNKLCDKALNLTQSNVAQDKIVEQQSKIGKELVNKLLSPREDDFGRSISVQVTLNRLKYFEEVNIAKVKTELFLFFDDLVRCRNQIVHFANFDNIVRGVVSALQTLFGFSSIQASKYPNLGGLGTRYAEEIRWHNDVIQHLLLHHYALPLIQKEILPRLLKKRK